MFKKIVSLSIVFSLFIGATSFASASMDLTNSETALRKDSVYGEDKTSFDSKTALIRQNFDKEENVKKREEQIFRLVSSVKNIYSKETKVKDFEAYALQLASDVFLSKNTSTDDIKFKDHYGNIMKKEKPYARYQTKFSDVFAYEIRKEVLNYANNGGTIPSKETIVSNIKKYKSFEEAGKSNLVSDRAYPNIKELKGYYAINQIISGKIKDLEIIDKNFFFFHERDKLNMAYAVPVKEKNTNKVYLQIKY